MIIALMMAAYVGLGFLSNQQLGVCVIKVLKEIWSQCKEQKAFVAGFIVLGSIIALVVFSGFFTWILKAL
jgi:uncharacterized membrane protein